MARSMERDDDLLDLANPSSAFCCLKMFFPTSETLRDWPWSKRSLRGAHDDFSQLDVKDSLSI